MTTYGETSVTCGVCGRVSTQQVINSTNCFGAPDLDLRPAPMQRWTIDAWIQACPGCGACAPDLAEIKLSEAVGQELIRHASDGLAGLNELSCHFLVWAALADAMGQPADAGEATIDAAWAADDAKQDELAAMLRSRAADRLAALPNTDDEGQIRHIRRVDLLRRSGRHQEAMALCDELLRGSLDETLAGIIRFQRSRAEAVDTGCYTVSDITAKPA